MRGLAKIAGPVGALFVVGGICMLGYDAIKAAVPLGIGALMLGAFFFDTFRWDEPR